MFTAGVMVPTAIYIYIYIAVGTNLHPRLLWLAALSLVTTCHHLSPRRGAALLVQPVKQARQMKMLIINAGPAILHAVVTFFIVTTKQ